MVAGIGGASVFWPVVSASIFPAPVLAGAAPDLPCPGAIFFLLQAVTMMTRREIWGPRSNKERGRLLLGEKKKQKTDI